MSEERLSPSLLRPEWAQNCPVCNDGLPKVMEDGDRAFCASCLHVFCALPLDDVRCDCTGSLTVSMDETPLRCVRLRGHAGYHVFAHRMEERPYPDHPNCRSVIPSRLENLAELQMEKEKEYGQAYLKYGQIIQILLGEVRLKGAKDHNRMALINHIVNKLIRYCHNWGEGHADSLDDASVYCQMLNHLDQEGED